MGINNIKLSKEFKAQTTKAIIAIIFFAFTYLVILLLSVGFTALCIFAGIMLIALKPMFITIALGIGLASLGILILIFLLKFIFKSHKVDRSHLYEIKKRDEPDLFALIDEIVSQVETTFPKKVYLSAEVNAAVFYDSSFWSMIFPVRKNLQIGLGLVNTVTKSELKAILSHEFGHFSQKTMKVGSYVYNVNQVIFNTLYDNDSYDQLIQRWASISGYFSLFVVIAVKIIEVIQWILRKLYEVVNKSYLGLSREMEFHADEIAANVTGFEPLKSSLLRMTLADHSYNAVLSFYETRIQDNLRSENSYNEHSFVLNFLAEDSDLSMANNLPQVSADELNRFNKSKLIIKDQWASHPSTEERIERLEKTKISSKQKEDRPANQIFRNIEQCQKELTNRVFKDVIYQGEVTHMTFESFKKEFKKDFFKNTFSKMYKGYYDNKNPIEFEISDTKTTSNYSSPEQLFSDQKIDSVYTAISLQNDIETLKQIANKSIPIKSFDYDGKKHKWKESTTLLSKLEIELTELTKQIKQTDICIFEFFRAREDSNKNTSQLEILYNELFEFDRGFDAKYEIYNHLSNQLQFLNLTTPFDQIKANFIRIEPLEKKLKKGIMGLMEDINCQSEITDEVKANFELYLSKQWEYFSNEKYNDENLEILYTAMNNYAFLLSKGYFLLKSRLLNYQEGLVKENYLI